MVSFGEARPSLMCRELHVTSIRFGVSSQISWKMHWMENSQKEYGKLSLDQFKRLIKELPEIRSQMQELPELVRTAPKEKISEILDKGFYWAEVYELPFHHQIALLFCALGRVQKLIEVSKLCVSLSRTSY